MEAWPAGAATATRAHPRRARFYCYIKVQRPPPPPTENHLCAATAGPAEGARPDPVSPSGPRERSWALSGRDREAEAPAAALPESGARRASKVTGSPQPSASQPGPTYCRPQSNLHF